MIKSNLKISDEEKLFCQRYIDNDRDVEKTAKECGKKLSVFKTIISKSRCQTWINYRAIEKERRDKLDYNYKMFKLKRVIDDFIPDDSSIPLCGKDVSVALSAIAESNKMQGHYSAEKHVNLNLSADVDVKQAKEETLRMLKRSEI